MRAFDSKERVLLPKVAGFFEITFHYHNILDVLASPWYFIRKLKYHGLCLSISLYVCITQHIPFNQKIKKQEI